MKHVFKRITVSLLSICIFALSVLSYPVSVYASDHGGGGAINHDRSEWIMKDSNTINVEDDGKVMYWIEYIISQCGAIISDHSITKAMANDQTMKSYIAKGYYDANEDTVTFPQETVTYVYNIIQEKAKEYNPFTIQQTYAYKTIPASLFPSKQTYNEFVKYCQSHYMVAFMFRSQLSNTNSDMFIGDVSEVVKDGGGFVANGSTGFYTVNANWSKAPVWYDRYNFVKNDDGDMILGTINESVSQCNFFYNYKSTTATFRAGNLSQGYLITKDGGRIRVFNSLAEFQDYNVGQRKVYFSSSFYDYQPVTITVTWDEISDTIDHMDDILQQILDKITDDTDESAIEELLRRILDELRNGGTGGGDGGSSVPSGWFDKVLESLEKMSDMADGYLRKILDQLKTIVKKLGFSDVSDTDGTSSSWFDKVLDYLKDILDQLKSIKRWTVVDTLIDGVDAIGDWFDLIHDILSDVDDGMESAVATLSDALDDATGLLKSKFPFSVPWDIFFFVTLLAAEPETPHFEVPIDFEVSALDMHIHYDFVVDFSDYQYLSDIFRVILSMTYAVGLLKMTAGIVNTKKEE